MLLLSEIIFNSLKAIQKQIYHSHYKSQFSLVRFEIRITPSITFLSCSRDLECN